MTKSANDNMTIVCISLEMKHQIGGTGW